MNARYVHVEVQALNGLKGGLTAEAEVWVTLPDGVRRGFMAQMRTSHAPFWRVVSIDDFGDPFVKQAIDIVGEDVLFARIAAAAALWELWDSLRAKDPPLD